jgi:hypothetical protein
MEYHVSRDAVEAAAACTKGFSCLNGSGGHLCPVEYSVDGKVHFITCLNDARCSMQQTFGNRLLCGCPVRKELYNRYGM